MKLYNTLLKEIEELRVADDQTITMYSCGPTVYDHAHIGNLASYIYADTLRRALRAAGYHVKHVMNITDVDDKTIRRSQEKYPELSPNEALKKLTNEYTTKFYEDMTAVGNDIGAIEFVKATDKIPEMQALILKLYEDGFAYVADDGVYFSIEKYKQSGKKYGQLLEITESNTSEARIQNDEYDKDSAHDFALWKKQKPGEPAWDFELEGHDMTGRPGWHIECSAMSTDALGQPFDIHTGGVDLIFPHHENEIAQSTAGENQPLLANLFFHNEHVLVDGKKMSKSLNNFYTLEDIQHKGFDPLAFRLMVLQSHYRSQSNFSWENLEASQNRLKNLRRMSDLRFQPLETASWLSTDTSEGYIKFAFSDDLGTPLALSGINGLSAKTEENFVNSSELEQFKHTLMSIDELLSLRLLDSQDISEEHKALIQKREEARKQQDWNESDKIRAELEKQGIGLNDTPHGPIWFRM